jgi:phosphatidylserine/phosphatidylglycerophosphate/cardiolipin synthase-like enzyme
VADPRFLAPDPSRHLESPQTGSHIEHLLGGNVALARMLQDIRAASGADSFVYSTAWNCEHDLVVPTAGGTDTLTNALSTALSAGAQVRFLLWAAKLSAGAWPLAGYRAAINLLLRWVTPVQANNANTQKALNQKRTGAHDVYVHVDDKYLFAGSHHQKIVIVGNTTEVIAYVGGIEFSTDRLYTTSGGSARGGTPLKGAPLFDISLRVTGPAAWSILRTFTERWTATVLSPALPALRGVTRLTTPPPPIPDGVDTQVPHTYGQGCPYPVKIQTAAEAIASVIRSTQSYFYMEDQYYVGTDALASAIRTALRGDRSRWGVVVIAAEDSVEDTPDVGYRRRALLRPLVDEFSGRFFVFERIGNDGTTTGPTAYVHCKLSIVDDSAAVVGSVNSNYRAWTHDTEVMLTVIDPKGPGPADPAAMRPIRAMRAEIWHRHLYMAGGSAAALTDPAAVRPMWEAIWKGKPMTPAHVRHYDTYRQVARSWPSNDDAVWNAIIDPRV